MGHVPWSLWMIILTALAAVGVDGDVWRLAVIISAPVVALWTASIVRAFCVEVLRTSARSAVVRTLLHQALIWSVAAVYVAAAVAAWPRLHAIVAR
jgi:hypothetical protein